MRLYKWHFLTRYGMCLESDIQSTRVDVGGGISVGSPMGRFEATYAVPIRYSPRVLASPSNWFWFLVRVKESKQGVNRTIILFSAFWVEIVNNLDHYLRSNECSRGVNHFITSKIVLRGEFRSVLDCPLFCSRFAVGSRRNSQQCD